MKTFAQSRPKQILKLCRFQMVLRENSSTISCPDQPVIPLQPGGGGGGGSGEPGERPHDPSGDRWDGHQQLQLMRMDGSIGGQQTGAQEQLAFTPSHPGPEWKVIVP